MAHAFYFAVPIGLWLLLRRVETQRVFSRLYLAAALVLTNFPSELLVGSGLWLLWAAVACDRTRRTGEVVLATVLLAPLMAFAHAALALMTLVYLLAGAALTVLRRPVPARSLVASGTLAALLLASYFATSRWLPPTNPTLVHVLAVNRYNSIDPVWLVATVLLFPMLIALWLLLLLPGLANFTPNRTLLRLAPIPLGLAGLWFAAAGTGLLTWVYARHIEGHVLALALALAMVSPSAWLVASTRPLMVFAAVMAVSAIPTTSISSSSAASSTLIWRRAWSMSTSPRPIGRSG